MDTRSTPPASVLGYVQRLADGLTKVPGASLRAAYLHGSGALGGWVAGRSDVDVLVVVADGIESEGAEGMTQVLVEAARRCPGRGLECSVVTAAQVREPGPPWPFLLHVEAGPGTGGRTVRPDAQSPGDPDLLMHYAVCRVAGWPVSGPPAREIIGVVPRSAILAYLAAELRWGVEHGPEAYAVLNTCRAIVYLTDGEIVSKIAGGEAALRRKAGPAAVIDRALCQQRGSEPDRPSAPDAVDFVLTTAAALSSAARDAAQDRDPAPGDLGDPDPGTPGTPGPRTPAPRTPAPRTPAPRTPAPRIPGPPANNVVGPPLL